MTSRHPILQDSWPGTQEIWETEDRLIPIMRISLALSAQLIVFTCPGESIYRSPIISVILGLYILYGVGLYIGVRRNNRIATHLKSWAHWTDLAWYLVLVTLSGRGSSIFFIGFLFPMIVASFRWGFISGLRVTIVSVLSFAAVSAAPLPNVETEFELKLVLLKSACLVGLGYMTAHLGGSEFTLRRRLELLDEFICYSNPRFGIDRTVTYVLEQLRDFYGARSSMMVHTDSNSGGHRLYHSDLHDAEAGAGFVTLPPDLACRLLELSPEHAAVHNARSEGWWHLGRSDQLLDLTLDRATKVEPPTLAKLAATLDAKFFVTVPVLYRTEGIGRLYVVAKKAAFVPSDMRFLLRVLDHVNPVMENIRLIEQLASHAADDERLRLARDIHDRVIQPYFGLQMGLTAIREKMGEGFPQLSGQIDRLMEMANSGINDLRCYVGGLKQDEESEGGLLPAMRRFAGKFSEATGIVVEVEAKGDIHANQLLAAEAFQMMTEGLNNIRKHTHAVRAKVSMICESGHLILKIRNESSKGEAAPFFVPASISERAAALGGNVRVTTLAEGGSSVIVEIPL